MVDERTGAAGEYFGALLHSPELCEHVSTFGRFFRTGGLREDSYAHWEREFVDQVLSADWKTNVVLRRHIPDAVAAGVRPEAIRALRNGQEDLLEEDERKLAAFIRDVVSGTLDNESFAFALGRWGARGTIEFIGFVLWLQWTIRMMQAIAVVDPEDAEIDQILDGLASGSVPLPDISQRFG